MNKCVNCKYWRPYREELGSVVGFGTCEHAEMYSDCNTSQDVRDKWQFCVVDSSDYFAALKTKESFGCTEFVPKAEVTQ